MHLRALTTLLSVTPLVLSASSPAPPTDPYFLITNFGAFVASPAYPSMHSWTAFNVTLMHPNATQRFTTLCMAHTNGTLCDAVEFRPCMSVAGAGHGDEKISFRYTKGLGEVEIMRMWRYGDMYLKTMANEGTNWDENGEDGNVTVSQYGKHYTKPEGWVFAFKNTVG